MGADVMDAERVSLQGELAAGAGGPAGRPAGGPAGRVFRAVLIRPGVWLGKGMRARAEVLRAAAGKFEGVASFLNPPPPRAGQHGYPGLERLLGVTENARWDEEEGGVVADYRLAETDAGRAFGRLIDGWLASRDAGRAVPPIGLSAVLTVRLGRAQEGMREVEEVVSVDQIDAVYRPAAGGEFQRVLNAAAADAAIAEDAETAGGAGSGPEQDAGPGDGNVDGGHAAAGPLMAALRRSVLDARLSASGLPAAWQGVVAASLAHGWGAADLDAAIARVQAARAAEESRHTVQGVRATVSGMLDSIDQIGEAIAALVEGRQPAGNVRPLSGIREAYVALSGDYEMTGLFHSERVSLANVTSTTMSNIVANVLNKRVVHEFQQYPRWWEPITWRENFTSLQAISWIALGGVGQLPAVAEGAAYTELTWSDAAETAAWQKRGGYLGITLEAMDKDDVGRLRSAPRALASAAWLTLGKSISAIFTDNAGVGPTLADGKALFHVDHANLGAVALSSASWAATKLAMRKQTELNSGERLGGLTAPKFLLVPPDLENTALTLLGSEGLPGTANNDTNVDAAGDSHDARLAAARRRVIVVDLWTDVNNWAAVADPRLYASIGLGFRYGETPEIFSVASPNSGLMFTNDVMPIKVRWFYAAGVMDHRGLYKANVA